MIFASDGEPRIGRFTVTGTPQALELPNSEQQRNSQGILIRVLGDSGIVYLGVNSHVSPTTGYPVPSGHEFSINLRQPEKLWVVSEGEIEIAWIAL